jgi:hypothetical protein
MGKQGCREVLIRADDAVVAARWLRNVAIPSMRSARGSILGGDLLGIDLQSLELLAGEFTRKAGRKRSKAEFSALVSVADAAAFARAVDRCRPFWPMSYDPAVIRLADAMRDGAQAKRRGRKWLSDGEVAARVSSKLELDERHRLRLAARSRKSAAWSEAWDSWFTKVWRRGQTILTTDLPFPKI